MDSAARPSASAISMAAATMRSRLSAGSGPRRLRAVRFQSSWRLRGISLPAAVPFGASRAGFSFTKLSVYDTLCVCHTQSVSYTLSFVKEKPAREAPKGTAAGNEIPRSLQLLWKRTARSRRGPEPALSRERIVAAAIEIADAEGLAALSMARLAERLGCGTMSLYRHVANKDELQVFMMDT